MSSEKDSSTTATNTHSANSSATPSAQNKCTIWEGIKRQLREAIPLLAMVIALATGSAIVTYLAITLYQQNFPEQVISNPEPAASTVSLPTEADKQLAFVVLIDKVTEKTEQNAFRKILVPFDPTKINRKTVGTNIVAHRISPSTGNVISEVLCTVCPIKEILTKEFLPSPLNKYPDIPEAMAVVKVPMEVALRMQKSQAITAEGEEVDQSYTFLNIVVKDTVEDTAEDTVEEDSPALVIPRNAKPSSA